MKRNRIDFLLVMQSVVSTAILLCLAIANHRLKRRLYQSLNRPTSIETEFKNSSIFNKNCQTFLTPAQIEVVTMVNQGLIYKEIAKKRNINESTIKDQMSAIGKRLKVKYKGNILKKLNSRLEGIEYS